jgi:hypothetical protein
MAALLLASRVDVDLQLAADLLHLAASNRTSSSAAA